MQMVQEIAYVQSAMPYVEMTCGFWSFVVNYFTYTIKKMVKLYGQLTGW